MTDDKGDLAAPVPMGSMTPAQLRFLHTAKGLVLLLIGSAEGAEHVARALALSLSVAPLVLPYPKTGTLLEHVPRGATLVLEVPELREVLLDELAYAAEMKGANVVVLVRSSHFVNAR